MRIANLAVCMGLTVLGGSAISGELAPAFPPEVRVGIECSIADQATRAAVLTAVRGALALRSGAGGSAIVSVDDCRDVTFCLAVVGVPVRVGSREGGMAIASYVSRRLVVHPNWPWPPPSAPAAGAAPVIIEDAFTATGEVACAPCQAELEALERKVATAREVARASMVDEGDLQLLVGPKGEAFLRQAADALASGLVERHILPWLRSVPGP